MTDYKGKKFSILGDSISTFMMYTPQEGVFYSGYMCRQAGILGVRDTWWMRVIDALGGELCVNDSWSGTTVSGRAAICGSSEMRTASLGEPDVILVFMGLNDAAYCVNEDDFSQAYSLMLSRLRSNYPEAEIWCGTLLRGDYIGTYSFFNAEAVMPIDNFNDIIRSCAEANGCHIADMAVFGQWYDSVDGAHPNYNGMKQIADMWLSFMLPVEIERKLLIRRPDEALLDSKCSKKALITQTYLQGTADNKAVRVRKSVSLPDGHITYTKNEKIAVTALTRVELESEIDAETYEALMEKADPVLNPIEKTRWCIPHEGLTLEIDIFPFWGNQAFCEIELESENQTCSLPDYIELIRDVSADKAYVNSALARSIPAEE